MKCSSKGPNRKRTSLVWSVLWWGLVFFVVIYGLIMFFEHKFIYFPSQFPEGDWQPWDESAVRSGIDPLVEDCYLTTADGVKLHGWYCQMSRKETDEPRAVLLWFHGNAGNITHRYDTIVELLRFGIDVFIVDYRGYGRSLGKPSEAGLYLDAEAAWDFLVNHRKITANRIVLFGRSLGGAVAIELAHRPQIQPAGLIIESSFTSVPAMASSILPILPGFLVRTKMDSINKVDKIPVPKLFVHSIDDEIIPYRHGRKLLARASEPKKFYKIEGAGHNETEFYGGRPYFNALERFIESCVDSSPK